ncbi:AAA family ATPase [Massilia oculi]|uniref:AAA family ATPase n=1 Tax=Massilia oculi TaxID=945844 RepID=UPI001AAEAC67
MNDNGPQRTYPGGEPGPVTVERFWLIALQLAGALDSLHRSGSIHGAVMPANIVWDEAAERLVLMPALRNGSVQLPLTGLAYLSPEQTGRTGRAADSRSDLYSLGATFYAMLTGAPPFTAQDAVELVHAHLARQPKAPHTIDPAIPPVLSAIVLKLLEKEPDRRYASAEALIADLRQAAARSFDTRTVPPFEIGAHDALQQLSIPDKLYGHQREAGMLHEAFDRTCGGERALVLIAGPPGSGKSALVQDLEQEAVRRGGRFAAGKFDQLEPNVPYAGLVQAFRALSLQLLAEPETVLADWRARIDAAIAPNSAVVADLIPELQDVLGPQALVPDLGPVESKNRFIQALKSFLDALALPGQPFVLFLDDLQWVDAASLQIIQEWVAARGAAHLLIVGAYRDDEVDAAHPLAAMLAEARTMGARVATVHVDPLRAPDVAQLLADSLQRDEGECLQLAELLVAKTAGNPLFIKRLLHTLHGESLIRFNATKRIWEWNAHEIEAAAVSDNVVELMTRAIGQLPDDTRQLILRGACIGYRFDLATLAALAQQVSADTARMLAPAVEDGLLVTLPGGAGAHAEGAPVMQFVHDRVQQAAYAMLDHAQRAALHLAIGRQLLRNASAGQRDDRLFDIVDQLNRGDAFMTAPDERRDAAQRNLAAARKAKAAAAYESAFDYLSWARQQLPADAWKREPALSFDIYRELAESAYLAGQHATAEQLLDTALAHAPGAIEKADLYGIRVLAATVAGDWIGALNAGREGLLELGQAWPLTGLAEANDAEVHAVMAAVGTQRIEDLAERPEADGKAICACMRLLSLLGPPAYFSGSEVLTFLVSRSARLSIEHGASVYSSYAYVFYGAIHNARTGEYDIGYALGKLALALARRFDNQAEESRTLEVFGLVVHAWRDHLRDSLPLMREGHRVGLASGELAYAAFNLCGILINGLPAGLPLGEVLAEAHSSMDFATEYRNRTAIEISLPFRQFVRSLAGRTAAPGAFDDEDFAQSRFLDDAAGNQTAIGHYWVLRLQAAYLFGDFATARDAAQEGAKYLTTGILGMVTVSVHAFYMALTSAAHYSGAPAAERPALREAVAAGLAQLENWARYCPENFQHKAKLVEAELARIDDEPWLAMECFGQAIDGASAFGFVQDAALSNELAALLFLNHGQERLAKLHLRAALDEYRKWGAHAKVRALKQEHGPRVAPAMQSAVLADPSAIPVLDPELALDVLGLIKASQAIAVETEPARLFERILQVVAELAGARDAVLLHGDAAALRMRGRFAIDAEEGVTLEDTALEDSDSLPRSLIRYVARTRKPLVLDDAATLGLFAGDAEVRALSLRSVLCVPLERNCNLIGVLYLGNDTMASVFTAARIEVARVLAAQAAISLENSLLLQERDRTERDLRQLADNLSSESRRKTEFLATLAHELRNPLAPLRTGLDLMRVAGNNPVTIKRVQEMMSRQLKQMVHLIDDLLDVARINSGKVHLKLARVDLRAVVVSAVEAVMPTIEAAGHTLDISIPDIPLVLNADATRLAQVLSNLLNNAAKYTPHGGRIGLEAHVDADGVVIVVADTGVGIPADALSEVFSMFSQVSKDIGRSQGGLGIGLALVRGLVNMHGGEVHAASAGEGKGSTFTVRLPLTRDAMAMPEPSEHARAIPHPLPTNRLAILLADDNVDAAAMMERLLQSGGHEVELVHDGQTAIDAATSRHYDLVLLDIGMPRLNGYQVAEAIRKLPGHAHTYLAALTGWGSEEDRNRTRCAGFDAHLVKPAGEAEIHDLLLAAAQNISRTNP